MFGFLRGDEISGKAGVGVDYEHRIRQDIAGFLYGSLWKGWGIQPAMGYNAVGGLRMRFR
ncbi:MAG TPA: hypothetical protein ENI05_11240 [Porticoccus sp.]|nr:hypothetical protein [Porticoccus sp.]